jgi:hypothetical protein
MADPKSESDRKPELEGLNIKSVTRRAKPRNQWQIDEVRWEFQRRRAGRFRLSEVINFLSKNSEKDLEWWANALADAIGGKKVTLRNPRSLTDKLPHIPPGKPIPRMLRAYYDCVDVDDVNRWLDANPEPEWEDGFRFASRQRSRPNRDTRQDLETSTGKRRKLTDEQRAAIAQRAGNGETHQKLAAEFGITRQAVGSICKKAASGEKKGRASPFPGVAT